MSTRFTNAVVHDTFEPPHTYKNEDGSEGIAVPPHVRNPESPSPPSPVLANRSVVRRHGERRSHPSQVAGENGPMATRSRVQHQMGPRRYPHHRCKWHLTHPPGPPSRSSLLRHTEHDSIISELRGTTRPLGMGRGSQDPSQLLGSTESGRRADHGVSSTHVCCAWHKRKCSRRSSRTRTAGFSGTGDIAVTKGISKQKRT